MENPVLYDLGEALRAAVEDGLGPDAQEYGSHLPLMCPQDFSELFRIPPGRACVRVV